jgi:hypothetical protein
VKSGVEQIGQHGNEDEADQSDAAASHQLLDALRLCAGVVVAVAFQQVDAAPDAEAAAKCDNEGLKNADSRSKKFHNLFCRNIWDEDLCLRTAKPE